MIFWYDYIDWLGGYPSEVATKEKVISFFERKGYNLISVVDTKGRLGCNEFIFRRTKICL